MAVYKFFLRPLGPYFFGGERLAELGNKTDYFQRSELFPQQTTLLGMLRYEILSLEGQLPIKDEGISDHLIGKSSFPSGDYGKINALSPVFLSNGEDDFYVDGYRFTGNMSPLFMKQFESEKSTQQYFHEYEQGQTAGRAGLMVEKGEEVDEPCTEKADGREEPSSSDVPSSNSVYEHWTEKTDCREVIVSLSSSNNTKNLDDLVSEIEKPGINKNYGQRISDNSYFRMVYKDLREKTEIVEKGAILFAKRSEVSWGFVFYADIDYDFDLAKRIVFIGAERSSFEISCEVVNEMPTWGQAALTSEKLSRLVLLSDAYIENAEAVFRLCHLVCGQTQRFRHMRAETQDYTGQRTYYQRYWNKSHLYTLLKRGSVLFTSRANEVHKLIQETGDNKRFHEIGYNHVLNDTSNFLCSK